MRFYDQAGVPAQDTQFYKKQFLAGHFLERLQLLLPQLRMNHSVHSCSKKTTVSSKIQPTYGKWILWSNPPCQQGNSPVTNRSNYMQLSNKMENVLSSHIHRRITTNLYFFILLQSESYSSWKTGGSDNLRIITISLWRNLKQLITRIQWTSKKGSVYVMCHHISFNNLKPPQAIGENVVKVPRCPMALNNTTDELFYTDASSDW